jgi:hypothetical protein
MATAQQDILNRYSRVTVIGAGVIGASWTALVLAHGLTVVVNDPRPDVETIVRDYIRNNLSTLKELGLPTDNLEKRLSFEADLERSVTGADLVQENGPERIEFKQDLWGRIVELCQNRDGAGVEDVSARAAAGGASLQPATFNSTGRSRSRREDEPGGGG